MSKLKHCPSCSAIVQAGDHFCGECGDKLPEVAAENQSIIGRWLFPGTKSIVTFQENGEVVFTLESDFEKERWEACGKWEQLERKLLFDCNNFTFYDVELCGDRMIGTCFHTSGEDAGIHSRAMLEREGVELSNAEMSFPSILEDKKDASYASFLFKGFKHYFLADDDLDEINQARRNFEQAVKIDPERPEAYVGLGVCYMSLDDYKLALKPIEQAVIHNFGIDARYESIRFEHVPDGGNTDEPIEYEIGIEVLIMYRAMIHLNLDDFDLAERDIDGVFDQIPEEYTADKNLVKAMIFFERNNIEKAWQHIKNALIFDPDCANAHHLAGNILFKKKDIKGAIKAFSHAISLDSHFPEALLDRAKAFNAIGAMDNMKSDIEALHKLVKDGYRTPELCEELDELYIRYKSM